MVSLKKSKKPAIAKIKKAPKLPASLKSPKKPKKAKDDEVPAAPMPDTKIKEPIKIPKREKINVKLTQDEINEKAILSCKVAAELEQTEAEAAEVKKEWSAKVKAVETQLKAVRRCVDNGEEYREVDGMRCFDLARGTTWIEFEGRKYLERPTSQTELDLLQQGSLEDHMPPVPQADLEPAAEANLDTTEEGGTDGAEDEANF
jgi:hypothetical protein